MAAPPTATPPALSAPDLGDLRVQVEDIIAAALDATAAPSRRRLGRRSAREVVRAAGRKALAILDGAEGKGASHAA